MSKPTLATDVWILGRRPSSDAFQPYTAFSAQQGRLSCYVRISRKSAGPLLTLDLFDEVAVILEPSQQGQIWFVKEARVLARHTLIGRSYEALRHASTFAATIARNDVPSEGRSKVYDLLRTAFNAFSHSNRPDIVRFKSLYCFARDEGYPVRQQWFPTLPAELRDHVERVLRMPLAELEAVPAESDLRTTALVQQRLDEYLRAYTELQVD